MMKTEILDIIEEFVGITGEKISSRHNLRKTGLNEAADEIIKVFQGKEKPGYPFEKVRKFLDEIYYLSINYRVHDLEEKIWNETQGIIKEINIVESDQTRLP